MSYWLAWVNCWGTEYSSKLHFKHELGWDTTLFSLSQGKAAHSTICQPVFPQSVWHLILLEALWKLQSQSQTACSLRQASSLWRVHTREHTLRGLFLSFTISLALRSTSKNPQTALLKNRASSFHKHLLIQCRILHSNKTSINAGQQFQHLGQKAVQQHTRSPEAKTSHK